MADRLTASERKHRNEARRDYAVIIADFEAEKRRLHALASRMIDSAKAEQMIQRGENPLGAQ